MNNKATVEIIDLHEEVVGSDWLAPPEEGEEGFATAEADESAYLSLVKEKRRLEKPREGIDGSLF